MKTQAQMTREYNDLAVAMGQDEIKRLRASASQTVEQKLDVKILEYNIWHEENVTPEQVKALDIEAEKVPNQSDLTEEEPVAPEVEVPAVKKSTKSDNQHVLDMNEGKTYREGSAKEVVYSCMHEGDKVSFILSEAVSLGLTHQQAKQALNNIVFKDKVAQLV